MLKTNLSNDVLELITEIINADNLLIRKIYSYENNDFTKQQEKTLEDFKKEIINSFKRSDDKYLKYFPILKKLGSPKDIENARDIFSVSLDQHVAFSSLKKINYLQEQDHKYDLRYKWDLVKLDLKKVQQSELLLPVANYLKGDKNVNEFVEKIGSTKTQKDIKGIEKISEDIYISVPKELYSIHDSNDISKLLPSELAYLFDTDLETDFYKRFIENQLIAYELQGKEKTDINVSRVVADNEKYRGSLIIFVDTSGSMRGIQEILAKAITYFLIDRCLNQRRAVRISLFSTSLKTLELNLDEPIEILNERLLVFLNQAYYGGTDITDCFSEIFKSKEFAKFIYCDVLVISDFIFRKPNINLSNTDLQAFKKRKNRMIALNVAKKKESDRPLKLFDEAYSFIYDWNVDKISERVILDAIKLWGPNIDFPLELIFKRTK